MSNYLLYKVWDETTYPSTNFNSGTVEVWESILGMSAYLSMVDKSWTMLVKLAPRISNSGEQPVIIKRVPNICLRPTIYLTLILFNLFQPFSYPLPISLH